MIEAIVPRIGQGTLARQAQAHVAMLAARGALDDTQRNRILAERDLARLERWINRAIASAPVAELLMEP